MARTRTRNTVIDELLKSGVTDTNVIMEAVLKEFPGLPESSVKRQVYSRRHALKVKTPA